MPPRPRKRKPANTWPNLDPGEGSVFEDEEHDGLLMDVERKPAPRLCGVGCHLARLLSWFGIRDDGKCGCGEHAAQMDALGPDWCEENIDTVVGWLREAAAIRLPLVPFVESVARQAVRSAIAAARRESQKASGPGGEGGR